MGRRAGGSGGVAEDAYTVTTGKYDGRGGVRPALLDDGIDPARIAAADASNGTTLMVDYAWADATPA
ncbi:MAG: hypothetical protein ABMB14_28555, partial [Myxococcota bacterium]